MLIGYMAVSADGFAATLDGSVDFLTPYESTDYGYETFLNSIDSVAMGRRTYEAILDFDVGWPYGNRPAHILTHRALDSDASPFVSRWEKGLDALSIKAEGQRMWLVGGPAVQGEALSRGLLDELHLFLVPVLLGMGIPLMPPGYDPIALTLAHSKPFENGMVHLHYTKEGR